MNALYKNIWKMGLTTALILGLFSCSTVNQKTFATGELFEAACSGRYASAKKTQKVTGGIWAKIESPDLSGQFPATVLARAPGELALEVTNLIGAPQAWVKIKDQKIEMKLSAENKRAWKNSSKHLNLGGLPLEFAPSLFLGRVPCPDLAGSPDLRMSILNQKDLEIIETDSKTKHKNRYLYEFDSFEGRPWVSKLNYEGSLRSGQDVKVEFKFESPTAPDRAARRWSASSTRGKIDIRWKDRAAEISEVN